MNNALADEETLLSDAEACACIVRDLLQLSIIEKTTMSKVFRITPKRVKRSNGQVLTPDMSINVTTKSHTTPLYNGAGLLYYKLVIPHFAGEHEDPVVN